MNRPSDSAGRSHPPRPGRAAGRTSPPPVGRRPEREVAVDDAAAVRPASGGLGGEAAWSPEPGMVPVPRPRPTIDPDRAMPGLPPRVSSAPPAPRVEIHPGPPTGLAAAASDAAPACGGCGYDLRGTPAAERCPECGRPVRRMRAERTIDAPLDAAPRSLIRRVALGCVLVAAAATLALTAITIGLFRGLPATSVAWLLLLAGFGWAAGMLLLSRPSDDPMAHFNGLAPRDPVRRLTRWSLPMLPLLPAFAVLGGSLAMMPGPAPAAPVAPAAPTVPPAPTGPPPVVGVQTPFGIYKTPSGPRPRVPRVAAAPQAPAAAQTPAAAPATFVTGVIDRLPAIRLVAVPFVLLQVVAGLLMLERIAVWVRDGFAERTLNVAQWLVPIVAVVLLVSGLQWTDGWGVRLDRFRLRGAGLVLLPLVLAGWLVVALMSLAAASVGSLAHAADAGGADAGDGHEDE